MPTPTKPNLKENTNGWAEYRRLVLAEIERLNITTSKLETQQSTDKISWHQQISEAQRQMVDKLHATESRMDDEYEEKHDEISEKVDKLINDMTSIKATAAALGAVAGLVVTIIGILISVYLKK